MQNVFTAHKQIEQTLRYLALIAQQTKEGIAVIDLDGSIQFVNEAWIEMHGYKTAGELIGKQLSLFHTKEKMKTDVIPLLEKTERAGRSEGTVEHVRSDGTAFPMQTKMILVKDDSGNATGLIVFVADIGKCTKLQETAAENLKQIKHFSERIIQLQKLFAECLEVAEYLSEQAGELQANNEILHQQMTELEKLPQAQEQYSGQIVHRNAQKASMNQQLEETKSKRRQPTESPEEISEETARPKSLRKVLNTKELVEVAELARRLSGCP
jgi:PAS domain S-box-containing protein